MAAAAQVLNTKDLATFDGQFLKLFDKLCLDCIDKAAACTEQVFLISKDFLDHDGTALLQQFYELYFGTANMEQRKTAVNESVDDLFDQIKGNLDSGKAADTGLNVSDKSEEERLGLAGLQKKIEGLIAVDAGMRTKIIPALSVMQFEDAVRQRLRHIVDCWKDSVDHIHKTSSATDFKDFAKQIAGYMSSVEETQQFYEIVVKEPTPELGMGAGDALLF